MIFAHENCIINLEEENTDIVPLAIAAEGIRQTQGNWLSVLDALRGAAALYVVCSHAAILMTIRFWEARAMHSLPLQALAIIMYIFAFGHQAVILFFVLSGFCIHFRQAQALHTRPGSEVYAQFKIRTYFARRWRRIVPPFYFALIFTSVTNWMTRIIYPYFLLKLTTNKLANQILIQHNSPLTFFGNIFFMQALACPTFGNDTPLWSLSYEFYLYALYPVFLKMRCAFGKRKSLGGISLLSTLAAIYISMFPGHLFFLLPVLAYWLSWVLGAFASEAYIDKRMVPKSLSNLYMLGIMGILWLATLRLLPVILSDTFGAVFCALFILSTLNRLGMSFNAHTNGTFMSVMTRIGTFSYSLYLTHVPVLGLISTLWFRTHPSFPTNPLLFLVGVCLSVAIGWLTYWFVERRFISRS